MPRSSVNGRPGVTVGGRVEYGVHWHATALSHGGSDLFQSHRVDQVSGEHDGRVVHVAQEGRLEGEGVMDLSGWLVASGVGEGLTVVGGELASHADQEHGR